MITTFLLEHKWITPTLLALIVVIGTPVTAALANNRRVLSGLTGLSLVPLAALTLIPQRRELFSRCEITAEFWWPTIGRVELMANVVLFVAPTLLVAALWRSPARAFGAGVGLSLVIESVQAAVPALGRSCDSNDFITNSMGAAIGAVLGFVALRVAQRRAFAARAAGA
ncbi:MAG: VanZ family protein [Actinobacteria bacterium]|nr:VanZ family protein [Actinomycetota bacterium]